MGGRSGPKPGGGLTGRAAEVTPAAEAACGAEGFAELAVLADEAPGITGPGPPGGGEIGMPALAVPEL